MQKLVASKSPYIGQIKVISLTGLATLLPLFSIFIVVYLTKAFPIYILTGDPSAIAELPPYIGLFSNIGILFWCACTAICLFSYQILKTANKLPEYTSFFLYSGILTGLLLLDDLFLLHETVFPKYLLISESIVYTAYLIIFFIFLLKCRKTFQKNEYLILLASIICFVLSIVCDVIWTGIPLVSEDIFKLLGITNWATYWVRLCLLKISSISDVASIKTEANIIHINNIKGTL